MLPKENHATDFLYEVRLQDEYASHKNSLVNLNSKLEARK